jgi:delta-aminolevulinic acid dehydratase/porphobilinogen synthase
MTSYWKCDDRRTCNGRCIIKADLVGIMVIKDGTDANQYIASDQGEARKVVNKLKCHAKENLNALLTQIMCMTVGELQEEKALHYLLDRNTLIRTIKRM